MGFHAKIGLIVTRNMVIIVALKLERYMTNSCILSIVIYKFYHGEEFCLVILLSINKNAEIGFHNDILSLDLTIYLLIKGYR